MAAPMRLAVSVTRPLETIVLKQTAGSFQSRLLQNATRRYSRGTSFGGGSRTGSKLLVAGSVAVAGVTLTTLYQRWSPYWFTHEAASGIRYKRPDVEPTKSIRVDTDNSGLHLTLFQFQTCPFCCKVRALLDYYGISYDVVEVNSVTKKQIKWSDYRKVPIMLVDGVGDGFVQLNDSSVIISALESWRQDPQQTLDKLKQCYVCIETEEKGKKSYDYPNKYFIMYFDKKNIASSPDERKKKQKGSKEATQHRKEMIKEDADKDSKVKSGALEFVRKSILASVFPPFTLKNDQAQKPKAKMRKVLKTMDRNYTKKRREERTWRMWADNHLVHMLSPNIYRTPSESLQAFRYFSHVGEWEKSFSAPERIMVIYTGAAVMYFLSKMLKRKYNLKEDVRESLYDACKDWTKAVGKKRKFMGGDLPNLADLAVYGVLNSIEGCGAFEEAQNHSPGLGPWYRSVRDAVKSHQGAHPHSQATKAITAASHAA